MANAGDAYLAGWAALTRQMHRGKSWSGRERNCCYLNLGDGTFADASAVTGLDFLDDGRAMAVTDWDGDGDLDVWLRNRTGPQLRFLRNDGDFGKHWVAFKLVGRSCNRDAIGARVVVEAGGKRRLRFLSAGDGYLSQSSKWLHFGLGETTRIDSVTIRWPDGKTQVLGEVPVDRRMTIVQGQAPTPVSIRRTVSLAPGALDDGASKPPDVTRLVLRAPLPIGPSLRKAVTGAGATRPVRLINLWAEWCAPCKAEIVSFAAGAARLAAADIDVVAVNVDQPANRDKARDWIATRIDPEAVQKVFRPVWADESLKAVVDAVLAHVRDRDTAWPLPTSLLVDKTGNIQIVYLGPVSVETLIDDAAAFGRATFPANRRAAWPGRWYYRTPRNLESLADALETAGLADDAGFYRQLWEQDRKQRRGR